MPKFSFATSFLSSPTSFIRTGWPKLKKIPGGNKIFSSLVSRLIPYTGSVNPIVLDIGDGKARVLLKDRRAVRNHLDCVHAIALANIGEFTTGLSVISQLPKTGQAILVQLQVEYLKKARGDLISEALFKVPTEIENNTEFNVVANITNAKNELVTKVCATWKVRIK